MYLSCDVCDDNGLSSQDLAIYKADEVLAHRQCARNADALKSDEGMPKFYLNSIPVLLLII